jgi:hypothetical protein
MPIFLYSNLLIIDEKYEKMCKDQEETPNLIIPKNFKEFIHANDFKTFI